MGAALVLLPFFVLACGGGDDTEDGDTDQHLDQCESGVVANATEAGED